MRKLSRGRDGAVAGGLKTFFVETKTMRFNTDSIARFFLTPYGIVILTVFMSWLGWALHGYTRDIDVFTNPEPFFSTGGLIVLCWYSSILLVAYGFFQVGRKIHLGTEFLDRYASLEDNFPYLVLTLGGVCGTLACVNKIASVMGWREIRDSIMHQQTTIFGVIIRDDYHRGPLTLRYLVIVSAGFALYRFLSTRRIGLLTVVNFLVLIIIMVAANVRLFVMASALLGTGLYIFNVPVFKVSIVKFTLLALILFALLTVGNSLRNASAYQKRAGNDSAISSNIAQMSGYLGTPFQAALAVGNKYDRSLRGEGVIQLAGVDAGMTTNSVFNQLTGYFGVMAWPFIWMQTACIALVMGAVSYHHRNYLITLYLVLLYVMAEYWRFDVLLAGGFIFLLFFLFFGTLFLGFVNKTLGRGVDLEEDEEEEEGDEESEEGVEHGTPDDTIPEETPGETQKEESRLK